jgi:hypothetical protein
MSQYIYGKNVVLSRLEKGDDIEKIYNSINKEYSISDYTFEDINDPYLNRYSVYIYYSKWDYYLFDVYDNYL